MKKFILLVILIFFASNVYAQDFNNVKYLSNYDGDTIKFDLGANLPELFRFMPLRLYGIDTPEIKSKNPKAYIARDFVANELSNAKQINLCNCKDDKYFHINCRVNYDNKDLTQELLNRGLGYEYFGGTKRK